jgi:hypothetical protein
MKAAQRGGDLAMGRRGSSATPHLPVAVATPSTPTPNWKIGTKHNPSFSVELQNYVCVFAHFKQSLQYHVVACSASLFIIVRFRHMAQAHSPWYFVRNKNTAFARALFDFDPHAFPPGEIREMHSESENHGAGR